MKRMRYSLLCKQWKTVFDEKGTPSVVPENVLSDIELDYSEPEYARALAIAHNGEVEIVEVEDPAPTQLDQIEAQVTYTAMMTYTLMGFEEE